MDFIIFKTTLFRGENIVVGVLIEHHHAPEQINSEGQHWSWSGNEQLKQEHYEAWPSHHLLDALQVLLCGALRACLHLGGDLHLQPLVVKYACTHS